MTVDQEIALGLQAAPEMAQQYGGLHPDKQVQATVKQIGNRLLKAAVPGNSPYKFDFHVLADPNTVNAFALPGGQIFMTAGLLKSLTTEDQIAGVLGHEIGHVIGRHSAEHMAKAKLTQGLTGAGVIATYDPRNPATMRTAAVAALIGSMISMRFGRQDELESDRLGVNYVADAGYDPNAMIQVMQILEQASGGAKRAEFFSTHPNPGNRIGVIKEAIAARGGDYSNGASSNDASDGSY